MAEQPTTIGVVGASARAAVHSLLRAGFNAWAVDLFGDRDLARVAPCAVCPLEDYPAALPRLAEQFPPGPVMYTGGLENHPDVVAELARTREVWGNPPHILQLAREPDLIQRVLADAGFQAPDVVLDGDPPPGRRWLVKPRVGSGGAGIRFLGPGERPRDGRYAQEFIDGVPMSAQFVSGPHQTVLLGVTEQLVGEWWLHSGGFRYCGNVGPVSHAGDELACLPFIGGMLAGGVGLVGLWGLDFVLREGTVWPVELNPRYTAAAEVVEHATGRAFLGGAATTTPPPGQAVGKAVYYAPHAITFPASGPWDADLAGEFDPWRLPAFADIPHPGTTFAPGQPVITILVSGSSPTECRERLQSRAGELDRIFGVTTS
jgi:predicted ATP-grasp superfamily ATP-dependent carboligase